MTPSKLTGSPPLTCRTLEGRLYQRRADVESGITAALGLSIDEWPKLTVAAGLGRTPSEVIVFLVRQCTPSDGAVFGALVGALCERVLATGKRWAKGFDETTTEEVLYSVEQTILDLIRSKLPTRQSEFLEIAFETAVKRHTLKAVEKRKNAPLPLKEPPPSLDEDEEPERAAERVPDETPGPEDLIEELHDPARRAALFRRAQIAVKDHKHYEALVLHFGFSWPISSQDPAQPSLDRYFQRSGRQIQNWLKQGLKEIRAAIGDQHD